MDARLKFYFLKEGEDFLFPSTCTRNSNFLFERFCNGGQKLGLMTVELTDSVDAADFVVFPYNLDGIYDHHAILGLYRFIQHIRDFARFASKAVFFFGDDLPFNFDFPSLFVRRSVHSQMNQAHTIIFPYTMADIGRGSSFEKEAYRYDTTFVGFVGSFPTRLNVLSSFFEKKHRLRALIKVRDRFHGHITNEQVMAEDRRVFLESLRESLTVLCPRGTGVNSYRFFEALCMGRIPILISDGCVLPFADQIDYAAAIVVVSEAKSDSTAQVFQEWLDSRTVEDVIDQGKRCRQLWLEYFARETVVEHLLKAMWQYKLNRSSATEEPFDANAAFDEELLLGRVTLHFEAFLKCEDDINALVMLRNAHAIMSVHGKDTKPVAENIRLLQHIIGLKAALQFDFFKNAQLLP